MKGILLVNLGSPNSPNTKDVKRYLGEFLMDERVIDLPYFFRFLLVKGIIVNTRSKKSAAAYRKIWTPEGSPLIVNSEKLSNKLKETSTYPVSLAMRYGQMSIKKGLSELHEKGVTEVFMIPLYPQHAMSTTETVIEKTKEVVKNHFPSIKMGVLPAFYNDTDYLNSISSQIESHLKETKPQMFVFSYHGLPERHIKKTDITQSHCMLNNSCCTTPSKAHEFCYRHQAFKSTEEIAKRLNLKKGEYVTTFQSRLGNDPWLKPYTDATLVELAKNNQKNIAVVTPSFVSDCLETLEEMNIENRDSFMNAGGESYQYIPCLNDDSNWVNVLNKWSNDWASGNHKKEYLELK